MRADLVVTVRSEGEDKPVVSFATTSIAIDEGDTNTVAILADGKLGPEVGSVMVYDERRRHALPVAGRRHARGGRRRDVRTVGTWAPAPTPS